MHWCDSWNWFPRAVESVIIKYGSSKPTLTFYALITINADPPTLFANLSANSKPIATKLEIFKARPTVYWFGDTTVTERGDNWTKPISVKGKTISRERKRKPQKENGHSQTVNEYTVSDGCPMLNIEYTVNQLAQYKYFSIIDLKNAYHQIPQHPNDKPYTAFQCGGQLYQFTRMILTNETRKMGDFFKRHELQDTYVYVENLIICYTTMEKAWF